MTYAVTKSLTYFEIDRAGKICKGRPGNSIGPDIPDSQQAGAEQSSDQGQPGLGRTGAGRTGKRNEEHTMKRLRIIGLALVAALAMSAVASSAAQANEGPFYKVAGAKLEAGKSEEVKAKALSNQVLSGNLFGFATTVTCTALKVKAGSTIDGGVPGTSKETLEYSGCTQTGLGSMCEVENKEVKTNAVNNKLVYSEPARKGFIDVLFTPASGEEFVNIKFTGSCLVKEAKVTGSVAGETLTAKARNAVGKGTEAKTGETWLPATQIKTVWVGETETAVGLKWAGAAATIEGKSEAKLTGEPLWSVATE